MSSNVVKADTEAEVILPPPTSTNPIPVLPVALRLDNQEQLLGLLKKDPHAPTSNDSTFRQHLVFADHSLRILLLRQVLSDPHARTFKGKKKNWDPQLSFPSHKDLNIAKTSILRDNNRIELPKEDATIAVVTYFLRSSDASMPQVVADAIKHWKGFQTHHRIVFLPQYTAFMQKVTENLGLDKKPNVSIHTLQLDLFPIETDVISLEYVDAMREAHVEKTPSPVITTAARSILKLQDIVGPIPRIQAYGSMGEEVVRKLLNMTVDEYLASNEHPDEDNGPVDPGLVSALVVIDRQVDLVTPMLTPLTYEALLSETVGIEDGFLELDVDIINPPEEEKKQQDSSEIVSLAVNGGDSLYAEVRDQHVEKFGSFLQNQAMALRESHANFTTQGRKKDLSEIHQFVKQIPIFTQNLRSLTNHIHLAELVKKSSEDSEFRERWQTERSMVEGDLCYDYLDELVATQYPPLQLLRLLCLQSVCSGGIRSSRYDSIRRDIVQTYGYDYVLVLQKLEHAGLLRRREGLWMDTTSPFNNLRKSLILVNAEVDTVDPDDIAYVSSGYAPLSVRLVQTAVKGWQGRDDILREVPGRLIDIEQYNPPEDLAAALKRASTRSVAPQSLNEGSRKPVLVVFYVGGLSYMEIAALRFLSKRPSFPYHIIICTTKVMNGSDMILNLTRE